MCIVSLKDINVTLKRMNLAAEQHIMYLMIAHTEKYNAVLRTLFFKYPKKKRKEDYSKRKIKKKLMLFTLRFHYPFY